MLVSLNKEMAVNGSEVGSGGISESGAYAGKIVECKPLQSTNSQAAGIELTFERSDGAQARFINIYTKKRDGTEAPGINQIHALLACTRQRSIDTWSQLCQPIGLVLQREDYIKKDGSAGYKMNIVAPFTADTKQTAAELIESRPAAKIDLIVSNLVDKKARPRQPASNQNGTGTRQHPPAEAYDDDMPF